MAKKQGKGKGKKGKQQQPKQEKSEKDSKKPEKLVPKKANIYVASRYSDIQETCLKMLKEMYEEKGKIPDKKQLSAKVRALPELKTKKKEVGKAMQFITRIISEMDVVGEDALALTTPFDEKELLEKHANFLKEALKVDEVSNDFFSFY